jgi:aerobic carbon-monoxide dehydrogenase large subunit
MPGVLAVYTGADLVAAGVKPIPPPPSFKRPTAARMTPAQARAGARGGALRRRGGGGRGGRDAEAARKAAADAVGWTTTSCPSSPTRRHAPRRARAVGRRPRQRLRRDAPRQRRGLPRRPSRGRARGALDLVNQRLAPSPMEPRSVLGEVGARCRRRPADLRMSSQMPTGVRERWPTLPGLAARASVRVLVGDVGGGFGMKTGIYPEDIVVAWAARCSCAPREVAGRAHRGLPGRRARPRPHVSRPSWRWTPKAACSALRVRTLANVGAYGTTTGWRSSC